MVESAAPGKPAALPVRQVSAGVPLVITLAACTSVLLLAQRSSAVAVWAALPLAAWVVAASRAGAGWIATGVQVAVTLLIAGGASGQLGGVAWSPSVWDAVFGYPTIALASCAAAVHAGPAYLRPAASRTVARRALSRLASVLSPLALAVACCLGGYISLLGNSPRPPDALVYPLPEGVSVQYETASCAPGTRTCTWKLQLRDSGPEIEVVWDRVAAHLSQSNGWPADLSARRCRAWGWIATERACLALEVRSPDGDHLPVLARSASLAIVITYR